MSRLQPKSVAAMGVTYLCLVWLALGLCAVACGGLLLAVPALAAEGKAPVIEWTSAGVGGEVTVAVQINPEGLDTSYEIQVECRRSEPAAPCTPLSNGPRVVGMLPAGFSGREVSLNVTGLQPGSYWFGVLASNDAGSVFRRSNILNIPPEPLGGCPEGCSTPEPYKPEVPPWAIKAGEEEAALASAEYVAKVQLAREAAAASEREAKAREEALIAGEAAAREAELGARSGARPKACLVPSLRGATLHVARQALAKAHCQLGKVNRPAHHRGSALVIARQSPRHGTRLPGEAAVSVTLARAHRQRA